jgi:hypothetical protein
MDDVKIGAEERSNGALTRVDTDRDTTKDTGDFESIEAKRAFVVRYGKSYMSSESLPITRFSNIYQFIIHTQGHILRRLTIRDGIYRQDK